MREVIVFKVNAPTISASGGRQAVTTGGLNDSYSTLITTRGRLRKKSGGRGLNLGIISDSQGYELICRFQSTLENSLRIDTKVDIANGRYTIDTWEKIDNRDHIYKFSLNFERLFAVNSTPITDGDYAPASSTAQVYKLNGTLAEGSIAFNDSDLTPAAGKTITILSVTRSGLAYSEVSSNPGNMEYVYSSGQVSFRDAGTAGGEDIVIIWKLE